MSAKAILLSAALLALVAALQSAPARAAQCVGFSDVDMTSTFCKNVEWMKNRGITLGCGDGTTYCPSDPVSRLAMAAFMNRMGKALSPQYINHSCSVVIAAATTFDESTVVCTTPEVPAVGYPCKFALDGFVVGTGTTQNYASLQLKTEASFDGGSAWQLIAGIDFYPLNGTGAILGDALDLPANLPIRVRYTASVYNATNTYVGIKSRMRIENDNGASSPY